MHYLSRILRSFATWFALLFFAAFLPLSIVGIAPALIDDRLSLADALHVVLVEGWRGLAAIVAIAAIAGIYFGVIAAWAETPSHRD